MIIQLRRITSSSHRYIAEIDGLRFVAIFSVLLFHILFTATHVKGFGPIPPHFPIWLWPFRQGFRGVELFFVISGFILGLPFASHYLANGRKVEIGRYYLRRVTRLEPPYIVALLGIYCAAVLLGTPDVKNPDFLSSLFLRLGYAYSAIHGTPSSLNGVTWTLEIEVQFYLLAPFFAGLFKLPTTTRRIALIALICLVPLVARLVPRSDVTLFGYAQFFFIGFLLADIHVTNVAKDLLPSYLYDVLGIGALLAVFLLPKSNLFPILFPWMLGAAFISALRGQWYRNVLRFPIIAVIGGMCYSLYLVHYPILSFAADKVVHNAMSVPVAFLRVGAVGLPIAVSAGIIYYVLLERPCMNPNWPRAFASHFADGWSWLLRRGQSTLRRSPKPTRKSSGRS